MVKNLIIKFGRLILDAIAAISFVVALLYSLFVRGILKRTCNYP